MKVRNSRIRTRGPSALAAGLLATTLFTLAACSKPVEAPVKPGPRVEGNRITFPADSDQLKLVTSTPVGPRTSEQRTLSGRLVWDEDRTVRVMPAFAGRVTDILVKPGDSVKAGQPLALMSSPEFGQVTTDTQNARAAHRLAQASLERTRELVEHGVAPRKDLEAAQADFAKADAELRRTEQRQALYAKVKAGSIDQKLAITAPLGGIVVERNINPGQELRPDQPLPNNRSGVFVISDPTSLWAILDAQERDLVALHAGEQIQIRVQALSDDPVPATIMHVADSLDPDSRTVKVRAHVDNAERKLKAEMFVVAQARFTVARELDLPSTAVYLDGAQQYVFVEEGSGRYLRKAVKVRPEADNHVEVLDGLNAGERVVTAGNLLLQRLLQENTSPAGSAAVDGNGH